MGETVILQNDWRRGMKSDFPRDQMPRGSAWYMQNYIPEDPDGAPLVKRGGFTYASSAISAAALGIFAGSYFYGTGTGDKVVVMDEDGRITSIVLETQGVTNRGISSISAAPTQNPVEVANGPNASSNLVFVSPGYTPVIVGQSLGVSAMTASAPKGKVAASHGTRLWIANDDTNRDRIWYSQPGDINSGVAWDTSATGRFRDVSFPIEGLASVGGALLVFGSNRMERIRGSPVDGDVASLQIDHVAWQGVNTAFQMAVHEERCYFANQDGVHVTDGTTVQNLTDACGIQTFWTDAFWASKQATLFGSIGFYREWVLFSNTLDALLINPHTLSAFYLTNLGFDTMFSGISSTENEELFAGNIGNRRLIRLSPIFRPDIFNVENADGQGFVARVETPFFFFGNYGPKRIRRAFTTYSLTDPGSENPLFQIRYLLDNPNRTDGYTTAASFTETPDGKIVRKRVALNKRATGIAFQLGQTQNTTKHKLYSLELELHGQEQTRLR
jgi:hypothetical protein